MSVHEPINPQITDSVTQLIKYKDGMGSGLPSKVEFTYRGDMLYDDAISKYLNPKEYHLPSIAECDILYRYLRHVIMPKNYMTVELRDDKTITVADLQNKLYLGALRSESHPVLLVKIEYEQ